VAAWDARTSVGGVVEMAAVGMMATGRAAARAPMTAVGMRVVTAVVMAAVSVERVDGAVGKWVTAMVARAEVAMEGAEVAMEGAAMEMGEA